MTSFKPIANPSRTAQIMKDHGIVMKKSLGQNFLTEPNILRRMVDVAEVDKETTVIEIGPGIGALTEFLARSAKEVFAFEIDDRFVSILKDTLSPYSNVQVIAQDILSVDFSDPVYRNLQRADRLIVVANLPYYITTPIIMHLIDSPLAFDSLVMMMQKEVAERMTAQVGTKAYNSLTLAIQLQMEAHLAFVVPKTVFIPKPKVDSAVLTLTRLKEPPVQVADRQEFQQMVQAAFRQRRKTLWNNFRHSDLSWLKDQNLDHIQGAFERGGIDPRRRAESLSLEEFADLYESMRQI